MPARHGALDEFAFGFSWVIDEAMGRASHALRDDGGRVWVLDPVDAGDAVDRAASLGTPAAVLQLLDRHTRDCAAVARRLGVPHLKVPDAVPGSPFETIPVVRTPGWKETALWWPRRRVLVVAEVVGTSPLWVAGRPPAGMHPLCRLLPPGKLRPFDPEHLLVGHGPGLHGPEAAAGLRQAYAYARRDFGRMLTRMPSAVR